MNHRVRQRFLVRGQSAVYHVVNRVALSSMILDDHAKAVFVRMMRKQARFAGVEILAFCVMTNHFHILVRVPEPREVGDAELLKRFRVLYGESCPASVPQCDVLEEILKKDDELADAWRTRLHTRMHNLSAFTGELKQRFSIWFNQNRDNKGTVWSERFRSVIVEDLPEYTAPVAAYIDLNPVRAQLVQDPGEYQFSSYGKVLEGDRGAIQGLVSIYDSLKSRDSAIAAYRVLLFGKGYLSKGSRCGDDGMIDPERVSQVISEGGRLSWSEYLRMKVGYFTKGAALGSRDFVCSLGSLGAMSPEIENDPRKDAFPLKGLEPAFYSFRNLRKNSFG
ncbi:MAG: transposase [Opitutales bacterium]